MGSRNSQKIVEGITKQTTGISNKVRFVKTEENSLDGAHEDDIEAQVVARNMNAGFDTARTDAADGQTTERGLIEPSSKRKSIGKHEREIEKITPMDKES